jgi:hypothetical protein
MNVGTINIKGLGSRDKRRMIRELVSLEKLYFLAIQETKMEATVRMMWKDQTLRGRWDSS